jgi:hypothetical protein
MSDTPRTRSDDGKEGERFVKARHEGRRRTLVYSIIAAGLVSWFFAYANDASQIDRSRVNCDFVQQDRRDRAESVLETARSLKRSSDFVLGDPKAHPVRLPADFTKDPFKSFASVKALVIKQAKEDRKTSKRNFERAKQIRKRIENCTKVFPRPNILPF